VAAASTPAAYRPIIEEVASSAEPAARPAFAPADMTTSVRRSRCVCWPAQSRRSPPPCPGRYSATITVERNQQSLSGVAGGAAVTLPMRCAVRGAGSAE